MLKTQTKEIDGFQVTSTQLDVWRALRLFTRLGKIVSPALAKAKDVTMFSDVRQLAPAFGELFSQVDGDVAEDLARAMLESTVIVVDGKQIPLNSREMFMTAFNGRLETLLAVMRFSFEVNFGDFWQGVARLAGAAAPEKVLASATQAAETAAVLSASESLRQ